jgi:hypothetical protein
MKREPKLPRELVWEGAHLSELGLTAIADGQDLLLERDAVDHADRCEWCAGRMGRAALLSAAVGAAVVAARPQAEDHATSTAHAATMAQGAGGRAGTRAGTRPWVALSLGIAVAVLAALPSLPHFMGTMTMIVAYAKTFTTHGLPVLARGGVALASSQSVSRALPVATIAASALLVMMGWAIARTRSHGVAGERSAS